MKLRLISLAFGAFAVACGGSPVRPSAVTSVPGVPGSIPTPASPLVAVPLSPANDAQLPLSTEPAAGADPVMLVAKGTGPADGVIVVAFQVARNRDFTDAVIVTAARGSEQASVTSPFGGPGDYYWRVRSVAGEMVGTFSETFHYAVSSAGFGPPRLSAPAKSSVQSGPIELVAYNIGIDSRTATDRFELATDPDFRSPIFTADVPGYGYRVSAVPDRALPRGQPLFWRVQAFDGKGARSDFSDAWSFTLGDAILSPPTLVSPLPGSSVMQRPTLTVAPGAFTLNPNAPTAEFQIATNPAFAPPYPSRTDNGIVQPYYNSSTSTTLDVLPAGTHYWRARMVQYSANYQTKTTSAWSDAWTFTVASEVIQSPIAVSPLTGATVHAHPTLIARNASRSGITGSLLYKFEVAIDLDFRADTIVAAQTVPEGAGQTSWTVPANLPAGIRLYWRAQASDPVSGVVSPVSTTPAGGFVIVRAATSLYTIRITIPSGCVLRNSSRSYSFAAISDEAIGAGHFTLHMATSDGMASPGLTVDFATDRTGAIAGTIGGSFGGIGVFADSGRGGSAVMTGHVNADGTASGTFAGYYTTFNSSHATTDSCTSSEFTWSIAPREG
jgi:hypothetical protein